MEATFQRYIAIQQKSFNQILTYWNFKILSTMFFSYKVYLLINQSSKVSNVRLQVVLQLPKLADNLVTGPGGNKVEGRLNRLHSDGLM